MRVLYASYDMLDQLIAFFGPKMEGDNARRLRRTVKIGTR